MKLRTELVVKNQLSIDPLDGSCFLGSCFSDNIGGKFYELGLPSSVNPFGVIFHTFPLADILEKACSGGEYSIEDLFESKGVFYSLKHHGTFSSKNSTLLLKKMNDTLLGLRDTLAQSRLLCLTLGSAWGYEYDENVVANCHKLNQDIFTKRLASALEIKQRLSLVVLALQSAFPQLQIVLTVSPIRHIKDGLIENSRSKAHLLTAVHEIKDEFGNVSYFPAYEFLMDDLRDYRFYKKDLIHPSEVAVDFIYEAFKEFAFGHSSVFSELECFNKLRSHKVMSKDEDVIVNQQKLVESRQNELLKKYPRLRF